MKAPLLLIIAGVGFPLSVILLLYPAILRSGAQSVTVDRDTHYSNVLDKYKGV